MTEQTDQIRLKVLEMKMEIQQQYIEALEHENFNRASILRAKLGVLDQLIKEVLI